MCISNLSGYFYTGNDADQFAMNIDQINSIIDTLRLII